MNHGILRMFISLFNVIFTITYCTYYLLCSIDSGMVCDVKLEGWFHVLFEGTSLPFIHNTLSFIQLMPSLYLKTWRKET
jgi:hypothetical protein